MKPLTTYCQIKFLESIFTVLPTIPFNTMILNEEGEVQDWNNLLDIIWKKSELYIDDYKALIVNSKTNPYFQKMINQHTSGGSKIRESDFSQEGVKDSAYFKKVNPSSLHYYLNEICNSNMGVFTNTLKNWKGGTRYISSRESFTVSKVKELNNFLGWGFLKKTGLPINAAIISDRYFLKDRGRFKQNLLALLINLIPSSLENVDFHLSIITSSEHVDSPSIVFKEINTFLRKEIIAKVDFTLFDLPERECPHDRDLVTNYFRLNSGNSFDYYDRNGNFRHNTKLEYFALNSESKNTHALKLQEFKNVMDNARYIGTGNNRLVNSI
jgi:hypothetical protein